MPSLIRSSKRKPLIGFGILVIIVIMYLCFIPQKIQSHGQVSRPSLVRFHWLSLHNVSSLVKCRNSMQGPKYITDELGYICHLSGVMSNGCCNADYGRRFDCSGCTDRLCCSVYEYCVSCCLNPDKKNIIQSMIARSQELYHPIYSLVKDQFEFCLSKCRTSSQSVRHENSYRNPLAKYCYGGIHDLIE